MVRVSGFQRGWAREVGNRTARKVVEEQKQMRLYFYRENADTAYGASAQGRQGREGEAPYLRQTSADLFFFSSTASVDIGKVFSNERFLRLASYYTSRWISRVDLFGIRFTLRRSIRGRCKSLSRHFCVIAIGIAAGYSRPAPRGAHGRFYFSTERRHSSCPRLLRLACTPPFHPSDLVLSLPLSPRTLRFFNRGRINCFLLRTFNFVSGTSRLRGLFIRRYTGVSTTSEPRILVLQRTAEFHIQGKYRFLYFLHLLRHDNPKFRLKTGSTKLLRSRL